MLIILEGPDLAGKTTLASMIHQRITKSMVQQPPVILHRGPPTSHPLDEYVTPLLTYQPGSGQHIICDRWHIGETIYPIIARRKSKMTLAAKRYVDMFLASKGALKVLVLPPREAIEARHAERGDDRFSLAQIMLARDLYEDKISEFHMIVPNPGMLSARMIIDTAWERQRRVTQRWYRNSPRTFVGSLEPKLLLVGDKRACDGTYCTHRQLHHPLGPAFMPYGATSGDYLLNALEPFMRGNFAMMNACDVDHVYGAWLDLRKPPIVALGHRASKCLTKHRVPHAAVPHPQFIRRFHHRAFWWYGQLIKDVNGTERNELKWRPSSQPATVKPSIPASLSAS